ncbi:unnamed protein product, partial [Oppiella nova]
MGIDLGRAFATSINARTHSMTTVPEHWSMLESATILSTYSVLYYALIKRAQLKPGESILIHSAAGGVGQSAINMCQHYGCDIYVTVGTEEKKEFLMNKYNIPENRIFSSRGTRFKYGIKEATKGKGVDIVLNSLSGERLDAGYECVANRGMYDLLRDIQFIGVAVDVVFMEDFEFFGHFFEWLHNNCTNGCVKPINYTIFGAKEADKAFRYMTTGKHIGKVVIKMRDEESTRGPLRHIITALPLRATVKTFFNPNKVYIITGGLGGFGLELIPWMQYFGARKFVVTSRSGIKTNRQKFVLNRLQEFYKKFKYFSCDLLVSTANGLTPEGSQQLVNEAKGLATIGGRTWTCGKGNGGQSNYSFGNSLCERICEERRRDGLNGLAVQYGPIGDVGVLEGTDQVIGFIAMRKQRIHSCCDVLDKLLTISEPIVTSYIIMDQIRQTTGTRETRLVSELWRMLGIDPGVTPNHVTLGELGLESMYALELQQEFQRQWNINVTLNHIKTITIGMFKDYEVGTGASIRKHLDDLKKARSAMLKHKFIIPTDKFVRLNGVITGRPVYLMPTLFVSFSLFDELAHRLNRPVIGLNWTREVSKLSTLKQVSAYYVNLLKDLAPNGHYDVVGYFDTIIVCTKLLLKGLTDRAVIVDVVSDDRFLEQRVTDDYMLDLMLTIISNEIPAAIHERIVRQMRAERDVKQKIAIIVTEVSELIGKGLVAMDMEEIFTVMFARIRMLLEYRMKMRTKLLNKLKLRLISRKWAKLTGKLVVIKPVMFEKVLTTDEFINKSFGGYFLPRSNVQNNNISYEHVNGKSEMDIMSKEWLSGLTDRLS